MDEIKSIISQLPPEDIAILQALYAPDMARTNLTSEAQRMIPIIDWLSDEEKAEVVNVEVAPLDWGEWEWASETNIEIWMDMWAPMDMPEDWALEEEEEKNSLWDLSDYLI